MMKPTVVGLGHTGTKVVELLESAHPRVFEYWILDDKPAELDESRIPQKMLLTNNYRSTVKEVVDNLTESKPPAIILVCGLGGSVSDFWLAILCRALGQSERKVYPCVSLPSRAEGGFRENVGERVLAEMSRNVNAAAIVRLERFVPFVGRSMTLRAFLSSLDCALACAVSKLCVDTGILTRPLEIPAAIGRCTRADIEERVEIIGVA